MGWGTCRRSALFSHPSYTLRRLTFCFCSVRIHLFSSIIIKSLSVNSRRIGIVEQTTELFYCKRMAIGVFFRGTRTNSHSIRIKWKCATDLMEIERFRLRYVRRVGRPVHTYGGQVARVDRHHSAGLTEMVVFANRASGEFVRFDKSDRVDSVQDRCACSENMTL